MNLHEDSETFAELIEVAAGSIGLPQIYVEKDYWVTRALKCLSLSSHVDEVVFKGGTSLSKAYRLIERFSEDIDLAVLSGRKGDSARKKLLKNVETTVTEGLTYIPNDERQSKGSKFRKTVYQYPRSIDGADFGQASSELVVEVNAFTHPEPYETRELQTFIADALTESGQGDLIKQFALERFSVKVLSIKRTLVEKMLGVIKDSYNADPVAKLSDRIRHLYDICLILRDEKYRDFAQCDEFKLLCDVSIADEKAGVFEYSGCFERPLAEAPLFSNFENWRTSLEVTYNSTFSDLVYGELPSMDDISNTLAFLHKQLKKIP